MNEYAREQLLNRMSEFTEWGGRPWTSLCRYAFSGLGSLRDKRVLEIGFRFGKMTSLFALLGGRVVALETDASVIPAAQERVNSYGVASRVSLLHYDGDLARCRPLADQQFDVIFSKSVLVLLDQTLPKYLADLDRLLAPDGRCVFLENGYGSKVFALMRTLFRRGHVNRVSYFTDHHLSLIARVFEVQEVKRTYFPPIYLILAGKATRSDGSVDDVAVSPASDG